MKLPEEECRQRFAWARALRLATADSAGQPHLVTATFAIHDDVVAIAVDHKPKRSTNLKRLRNIRENPAVAVLVDQYDDDWAQLWWVRGDGVAEVLPNELATPEVQMLVDKYPQYQEVRPSGEVIQIRVTRWSGWSAT
jgi:PPOX class probable F420-dependent enzyme